jgi:adenylylsulfate kinase-like enzyme
MTEKGGENEAFVKEVNRSGTLWLRGLPAAGKTTLANILHKKLKELGEFKFEKRLFPE